MAIVSSLKEAFAFASVSDREKVLKKFVGTQDVRYYQGLVLLQKLYDETIKQEDTLAIREPTEVEGDLIKQMHDVLNMYNDKYDPQYEELNTRFHLLAYPFYTSQSTEFIKEKLNLEISKKQDTSSVNQWPSKLDRQLVDSENIVRDSLKHIDRLNIEYAAIPVYMALLEKEPNLLSDESLVTFVKRLLSYPTDHCPAILDLVVKLWQKQEETGNKQWCLEEISFTNLTLKQLDHLIDTIPELVCKQSSFVQSYLERLIPRSYYSDFINIWDDDKDCLLNYLNQAEQFVEKLPKFYAPLKAAVKFHKLRIDITRNTFSQEKLIEYLALSSGQSSDLNSPTPSRMFSVTQPAPLQGTYVGLPLFGACEIERYAHLEVLKEYLTGIAVQGKLTITPETLGAYEDYQMLTSLFERVKLTTESGETKNPLVTDLSIETLAQETLLTFAPCSLYKGFKRNPQDDILLKIKTKNIARLAIRVFQMDTEAYWRLHPRGEITKDVNLDGLCPTWEKSVSFQDESPLHIKCREFVFGKKGLAPEVFAGRGLWVIEFVGDNHQCCVIVQKGYLRHVVQKTTVGHLFKIIDEEGKAVEASKIIYEDQVYEADESQNILIPYLQEAQGSKSGKMILVSPKDGFYEPADFYHESEQFELDAVFHVNHEMVSFNKKATVVVVPKLTLHNMPYSSIEGATLKVDCTNPHKIKSTATTTVSSLKKPIQFEFTVPELLTRLEFNLEVKVKTLNGSTKTVSVYYNYKLNTESGQPINTCLKKSFDGQYLIYVLGANGEPKPEKDIHLTFNHGITSHSVSATLQSNNEGIVELGELPGIESVNHKGQIWRLTSDESIPLLPSTVCIEADKSFKLSQSDCHIYRTGYKDTLLENVSECIARENGMAIISNLAEGEYKIFLNSPKYTRWNSSDRNDYIHYTVVAGQSNPKDTLWKNWVLGKCKYIQQNLSLLQRPLNIESIHISNDSVDIELSHWSQETFAVVSMSTFVPTVTRSLIQNTMGFCSLFIPDIQEDKEVHTKSVFLDDKQIGEEYQYILKRARSEKWAGSNLAQPSLLIHPKENSSTTSEYRTLELESIKKTKNKNKIGYGTAKHYRGTCRNVSKDTSDSTCFAFLDHASPIIVAPVDPNTGHVLIDRRLLGNSGSFLEFAVISGEQAVCKNILMDQDTIKYNDMRQDKDQELTRSKSVSKLLPNVSIELNTNEFVVVDTIEKLFTVIGRISPVGEEFQDFDFFKRWPNMSEKEKCKTYSEKVCHEFNFWLKKRDPSFFKQVVYPGIKSKIKKSFMDSYLLEEDLSMYSQSIYAFEQLNTAEKALLATTQSQEFLNVVLQKFKDSLEENQAITCNSDAIFDSIFADAVPGEDEGAERSLSGEDMGFGLFSDGVSSPQCSPSSPSYDMVATAYAPTQPEFVAQSSHELLCGIPRMAVSNANGPYMEAPNNNSFPENEQENDPELEVAYEKLREKARELQKKKKFKYSFIKPTTEWTETSHYNQGEVIDINQFWVDYLEHKDIFLSPDFIYNLKNITQVMWVMNLMDLPFTNKWTKHFNVKEKQVTIQADESSPLLIFHRQLSPVAGNHVSLDSIVVCEELFVYDRHVNVMSDECIKIDPLVTSLEPQTHYGCQLVISNVSSTPIHCEFTYQIPTGSIPLEQSFYRRSKSVFIHPYSTWRDIAGTFYFPQAGQFSTVSTTALIRKQGQQFMTKATASKLSVVDRSKETSAITALYWPTTATHGSNADVLSFLATHKRLDRIDLSLICWRMTDAKFARQVFNVLSHQRCFFSDSLWKYGIYHQFADIIKDLLEFNNQLLLGKTGQTFKSPLISTCESNFVYDYFPIVNARAHPLQSTQNEILNRNIYSKYNTFLDYLCQQTSTPSVTDLLVLTQYLVLQNRIGEAQDVFSRVRMDKAESMHTIQIDYLNAYLKTRISLSDQEQLTQLDLAPIKEILEKYKNFGIQRWRETFDQLREFVYELERGHSSSNVATAIESHPVLEFSIDSASHELVIKYTHIKSITIGYYEMDIETMFSANPFMSDTVTHDAFKLIKPTCVEHIELNEPETQKEDEEDDFDIIGLGQVQSTQISRVPFKGDNKNMMVEIKANSFTPNATTTSQRLEKSAAYYSNSLDIHVAESFGIVRVMGEKTKRPVVGAYVKVYARLKNEKKTEFWKDGYTGLNGVFDYMSVTEGNALIGENDNNLQTLVNKKIDKLSLLIMSQDGAVVKEVYPPLT